jgi:hypothetical protein
VHPDASRPVLRGQQVRQAAWRSDDLPFNKIVFVLRPIVLFVGSLVGQFAARIIGNLRDRALAFGPADRANGEMEDRHVSNRDFGLVGKKDRCPARGSEPLPATGGAQWHRGGLPAMHKCEQPAYRVRVPSVTHPFLEAKFLCKPHE